MFFCYPDTQNVSKVDRAQQIKSTFPQDRMSTTRKKTLKCLGDTMTGVIFMNRGLTWKQWTGKSWLSCFWLSCADGTCFSWLLSHWNIVTQATLLKVAINIQDDDQCKTKIIDLSHVLLTCQIHTKPYQLVQSTDKVGLGSSWWCLLAKKQAQFSLRWNSSG